MAEYKAKGVYNDYELSDADRKKVEAYKQQYAQAQAAGDTAGMEAAHAGAESVRAGYGYSGGSDGSEYHGIEMPKDTQKQVALPSATPQNEYIQDLYKAQQESQMAALESAYNQKIMNFDAANEKIEPVYQAARNQTAGSAAVANRNFDQRAAATGLNSGTSGQAALARSNVLQSNLNAINVEEANAKNDLQNQRLQTQQAYLDAIAQAKADGSYALAEALYNEALRVDNSMVDTAYKEAVLNQQVDQTNYERRMYQQELDRALAAQNTPIYVGGYSSNNNSTAVDGGAVTGAPIQSTEVAPTTPVTSEADATRLLWRSNPTLAVLDSQINNNMSGKQIFDIAMNYLTSIGLSDEEILGYYSKIVERFPRVQGYAGAVGYYN